MSEPPKCKMCGERHWRPPCPSFQKSSPARKPSTKPVEKTQMSSSISPSIRRTVDPPEPVRTPSPSVRTPVRTRKNTATSTVRTQKWRASHREGHAAYMRAYRARQKAAE
jgi:hypothetical protein